MLPDGYAFDASAAPSAATMTAWTASPYDAVGVFIGGVNRSCHQPNLTSTWVTEDDVRRLRILRAVLAAGVNPDRAVTAVAGTLPAAELAGVRTALDDLGAQLREAVAHLRAPGGDDPAPPPEETISLMFDTFMVRSRMTSVLSSAMKAAGVVAGDYALLSLLVVDDKITPATLTRLLGRAPSTVAAGLARSLQRGWVRRRVNPHDPRSCLVELTPQGRSHFEQALPYATQTARRIDAALRRQGADPDAIRTSLLALSRALRSLLPDSSPDGAGPY